MGASIWNPNSNLNALDAGSITYSEADAYGTRTVEARLRDFRDVKGFGAIGDGASHPLSAFYPTLAAAQVLYPFVTSLTEEIDGAAIQAAIDYYSGGTIWIPEGNYITSRPILLTDTGTYLRGGGRNSCNILANFRGGAVFQISAARCTLTSFVVSSLAGGARRLACPRGKTAPDATVDGNSEDYGVLFKEDGAVLTFSSLIDMEITNQPADGIVWMGEGSCTIYDRLNVTFCGGHGMYFDEGGRAGLSLGRPGILDIKNCLVQQCWGHGIALATEGTNTCYRFNLINCEVFSNCLGDGGVNQPPFYSTLLAEIAARCQNFRMELGAVGNSEVGILLGTTTVAEILGTRFISLNDYGIYINPSCSRIRISMPYYDPDPGTAGIRVRETCDNVVVEGILDGDLTAPIDAESEVKFVQNNKVCYTVPGTDSLWKDEQLQFATISSGDCNIQSKFVGIIGEGNVADAVSRFRFVPGIFVPDGYSFTVCNFNAYNINIQDLSIGGVANIQCQGSTAVLEPGESLSFVAYGNICYAIGREIP